MPIDVGGLLDRLLERLLDHVGDRGGGRAVGHRLGRRVQQPGVGVAEPGRGQAAGDEQHLDARLVERREHAGQPAGAALAAADALGEPVERLALDCAGVLLDPLGGAGADLVDRRVLDVAGDPAGQALAQVGVQAVLEVADELVGRADQQAVEAVALVERERRVGRAGDVVVDLLVDAALVVGL